MKNIVRCTKHTIERINETKIGSLNKLIKVVDIDVTDQVKKREVSRIISGIEVSTNPEDTKKMLKGCWK